MNQFSSWVKEHWSNYKCHDVTVLCQGKAGRTPTLLDRAALALGVVIVQRTRWKHNVCEWELYTFLEHNGFKNITMKPNVFTIGFESSHSCAHRKTLR